MCPCKNEGSSTECCCPCCWKHIFRCYVYCGLNCKNGSCTCSDTEGTCLCCKTADENCTCSCCSTTGSSGSAECKCGLCFFRSRLYFCSSCANGNQSNGNLNIDCAITCVCSNDTATACNNGKASNGKALDYGCCTGHRIGCGLQRLNDNIKNLNNNLCKVKCNVYNMNIGLGKICGTLCGILCTLNKIHKKLCNFEEVIECRKKRVNCMKSCFKCKYNDLCTKICSIAKSTQDEEVKNLVCSFFKSPTPTDSTENNCDLTNRIFMNSSFIECNRSCFLLNDCNLNTICEHLNEISTS